MNRRQEIDRNKQCPFLLRLFWKENDYHKLNLFEERSDILLQDEVQIYTWRDATLKELVEVLKTAIPHAQKKDAKFRFSSVYQDPKGSFKRKDLGTIRAYKESREDNYTLSDLKFFVGDCIDLTIITSIDKQKV